VPAHINPRLKAEETLGMIASEFADLSVHTATSAPCARPADLAHRYQETCRLLDVAATLGVSNRALDHDRWKMYALLVRNSDAGDVKDLAHGTLDPLIQSDAANQGSLLATLETYLDETLSPSRTAATLYVHLSTVKYRLKRISELLDRRLDKFDDILTVKVALMVRSLDPVEFDSAALAGNASMRSLSNQYNQTSAISSV